MVENFAKANLDRYTLYNAQQISFSDGEDQFSIDDDKDGNVDCSFNNPDFNFLQFRSNLVLL